MAVFAGVAFLLSIRLGLLYSGVFKFDTIETLFCLLRDCLDCFKFFLPTEGSKGVLADLVETSRGVLVYTSATGVLVKSITGDLSNLRGVLNGNFSTGDRSRIHFFAGGFI
jgi:hypothetical protein